MIYYIRNLACLKEHFWQRAFPALDAARQAHTLRWRAAHDRNLSVLGYLLLRLGLYKEYGWWQPPRLVYGQRGKPCLHKGWPHFSLSSCPQAVLCALDTFPVGIDVALPSAFSHSTMPDALLPKIYNAQEISLIQGAADRAGMACTLWAAKESLCKCTGEGLTDALPYVLSRSRPRLALHGTLTSLPLPVAQHKAALPAQLRLDGLHWAHSALTLALCRTQRGGLAAPVCHEVRVEDVERLFLR
jgi:phosphopantetheinyl transferase